jgi:hypothetical protein
MSVSYELHLATPDDPEGVAGTLRSLGRSAGLLDDRVQASDVLTGDAVLRRGTRVWVGPERPPATGPLVRDLGVTPTVWVSFRLDLDGDARAQQDDMVRLVVALLAATDGDAVLEYETDVIWLLRRDGRLHLSDDDTIWPPHRLALVPLPHDRTTLAFADG